MSTILQLSYRPVVAIYLVLFIFLQVLPLVARDHSESNELSEESLLWGPYRPNLYLGIRPRIPNSLLMGLMWSNADEPSKISNSTYIKARTIDAFLLTLTVDEDLRHTCEQNEGMAGYGWVAYDVRRGGTQIINDTQNKIDLTTDFVKFFDDGHFKGWGLRIRGDKRADANENLKTTAIFYLGNKDPKSNIKCVNQQMLNGSGRPTCEGIANGLGAFKMRVLYSRTANYAPPMMHVKSLNVSGDDIWKTKSIYVDELHNEEKTGEAVAYSAEEGNLHFMQQTIEGDFEFEVLFSSDPYSHTMTHDQLTHSIQTILSEFNDRFNRVFSPQAPFREELYVKFSQSLLSNLMGGIGYFYGTSKVEISSTPEPTVQEQGPYQLFTSVPSRPFFPRGFLWDEGFHLQIILDWDMDLALETVLSWFDLMDENGWIAREQILGPEARDKVPLEFQTQHREYANPPTLFLVIQAFHARLSNESPYLGNPSKHLDELKTGKAFLGEIYLKMKKHYEWFCRTQAGNLTQYGPFDQGYRWRGRTPQHILTSGLDDYPRAESPHPEELHVDALCWVGLMDSILMRLATFLGEANDQETFSKHQTEVIRSIDGIHWSELDQTYCDTTVVSEDQVEKICHKGYISLFPFLTGLMASDHPHTGAMLDLIHDPEELWSPHGLRSLSRKDKYYGTNENYWRSPVWININFMAVEKLLELAHKPGPYQQKAQRVYTELRLNLVNTVFNSWKETGLAWEQYHPDTGKGQRTQHFTGWTALIVKIMAMPDLASEYQPHSPTNGNKLFVTSAWNRKLTLMVIALLILAGFILRRRLVRLLGGLYKGDKKQVR